jgi:hypothetical protein
VDCNETCLVPHMRNLTTKSYYYVTVNHN